MEVFLYFTHQSVQHKSDYFCLSHFIDPRDLKVFQHELADSKTADLSVNEA